MDRAGPANAGHPSPQEIFDHFVSPLLEQIRTDATQQIATLAENRLGICGPITSVRQRPDHGTDPRPASTNCSTRSTTL